MTHTMSNIITVCLTNITFKVKTKKHWLQILGQKEKGTTVVVVEMPVPDTYFSFFSHPETDYLSFMKVLSDAYERSRMFFFLNLQEKI
jgi:hypothetical protein